MRLKHYDYIKLVTWRYKKIRDNGGRPLLVNPTRSGIRRECINVFRERFEKRDVPTLKAFFGPPPEGKSFLKLIELFEVDKFRPLYNYLKGKSENTDDTNIELLAWLINFEHRPFHYDNDVLLNDEDLAVINEVVGDIEFEEDKQAENKNRDGKTDEGNEVREVSGESEPEDVKPANKLRVYKNALIAFIFLLLAGVCGSMLLKKDRGCMYWAGDHYEHINCESGTNSTLVLPLNKTRLNNLKKITREDTITEKSIGNIYYIKDSNKIEFYTEGGRYPEDVTRTLKKLSAFIYNKYVNKNDSVGVVQ